jgi:hypothetical protein
VAEVRRSGRRIFPLDHLANDELEYDGGRTVEQNAPALITMAVNRRRVVRDLLYRLVHSRKLDSWKS